MIFVETSVFTREIRRLLSDDNYRHLQTNLMLRPEAGKIIIGGGGLRKIRWGFQHEGKRGGLRIIYYFDFSDTIYMLYVFRKSEQEDLTPKQLKVLRNLVKEYLL